MHLQHLKPGRSWQRVRQGWQWGSAPGTQARCWWGCELAQPFPEQFGGHVSKMPIPFDPQSSFPRIYAKETEQYAEDVHCGIICNSESLETTQKWLGALW